MSRSIGEVDRATRPAVCCVGPLPPPHHGMANVQAAMVEALRKAGARVWAIGSHSSRRQRGLAYHLEKTGRSLGVFARILAARLGGARAYYANVDDGMGGVWTASFALLARLLGFRLHLHHHSYLYLVQRSRLMAFVAAAAGPKAVHIALCEDMADALRRTYPAMRRVVAVPNCVELPPPGPAPERAGEGLVLGMMANLTFEKGVAVFVDIVRRAAQRGDPVRGILAGPAVGPEVERFLAEALSEPGLPLEWRGAVSGEAKAAFFRDTDLFVFPTAYRTEAYPLVLLEALVHGVPIIAPRRGCIGAFDALPSATIVPLDEDFADAALAHLARLGDARPHASRAQARADGKRLNAANAAAREALLDRLAAAG